MEDLKNWTVCHGFIFFDEIYSKILLKTLIKSNKINKKRRLPFFFYLTLLSDDERISVNFFFHIHFHLERLQIVK